MFDIRRVKKNEDFLRAPSNSKQARRDHSNNPGSLILRRFNFSDLKIWPVDALKSSGLENLHKLCSI